MKVLDIRGRFGLMNQERDILQLLIQGYTHKEMSEQLAAPLSLLRRRIGSIYRELDAHSCSDAVELLRDQFPDLLAEWEEGATRLFESDLR